MQVHEVAQVRVDLRQLLQASGELFQILIITFTSRTRVAVAEQRDIEISTPLLCASRADVVDHESTKYARGIRQEPRTIQSLVTLLGRDLEVRFVKQRRRTQGDVSPGAAKLPGGEFVKLVVQRGEQRSGRNRITTIRGVEQLDKALHGSVCWHGYRC